MEQSRRNFLKLCGAVGAGIGLASLAGESVGVKSMAYAAVDPSSLSWKQIRDECFTLSADYIYMNNSTMGPTLKTVQEHMNAVRTIFAEGCTIDRFMNEILLTLSPMREKMREVVNWHDDGAHKGRYIGNVDSVTEGMSLVANGIRFEQGDVILTTDHEHSGGRSMWELQCKRYGCELKQVPLLAQEDKKEGWKKAIIKRFESAFKSGNVKVLSFSWVTTSTGHVLPAKELCDMASHYGAISVIDAAQAFTILPIDVRQQGIDCDFMVVNGHKYLCGPIGSGFVCIHPRQMESFESFYSTVVDDNYYHPENPALNYPHRKGGLSAYTNVLPLMDALTFYQTLGAEKVYERLLKIGQWLRAGLSEYKEFDLVTPEESDISCVMTCFRVSGVAGFWETGRYGNYWVSSSENVYRQLKAKGIQVKNSTEGFDAASNTDVVRISPHYYNTPSELDALRVALCEIANVTLKDNKWPSFSG